MPRKPPSSSWVCCSSAGCGRSITRTHRRRASSPFARGPREWSRAFGQRTAADHTERAGARVLEGDAGLRRAFEPRRAFCVELCDLGSAQAGKSEPDVEAGFGLQVAQVAIALWETSQQFLVEVELAAWLHRVEAVLLVDRLTAHDGPAALAPFEKIVEATRADGVDDDAIHGGSLADRHLRLRDRAVALLLDRRAAEKVNDADAALEAGSTRLLKLRCRPLEPCRRHPGVVVPDGRETLPVA